MKTSAIHCLEFFEKYLSKNKMRGFSKILATCHLFSYHLKPEQKTIMNFFILLINLRIGEKFGYAYKHHLLLKVPDKEWNAIFEEILAPPCYPFPLKGEKPTIVEIGAHLGFSIIAFKRKYPRSKIFGFESNPVFYQALEENVAHNAPENIFVENSYVCSSLFAQKQLNHRKRNLDHDFEQDSVGNITLQEVLKRTGSVDLLKIDAEGIEYDLISEVVKNKMKIESIIVIVHPYFKHVDESGREQVALLARHYNLFVEKNFHGVKKFTNVRGLWEHPLVVYGRRKR